MSQTNAHTTSASTSSVRNMDEPKITDLSESLKVFAELRASVIKEIHDNDALGITSKVRNQLREEKAIEQIVNERVREVVSARTRSIATGLGIASVVITLLGIGSVNFAIDKAVTTAVQDEVNSAVPKALETQLTELDHARDSIFNIAESLRSEIRALQSDTLSRISTEVQSAQRDAFQAFRDAERSIDNAVEASLAELNVQTASSLADANDDHAALIADLRDAQTSTIEEIENKLTLTLEALDDARQKAIDDTRSGIQNSRRQGTLDETGISNIDASDSDQVEGLLQLIGVLVERDFANWRNLHDTLLASGNNEALRQYFSIGQGGAAHLGEDTLSTVTKQIQESPLNLLDKYSEYLETMIAAVMIGDDEAFRLARDLVVNHPVYAATDTTFEDFMIAAGERQSLSDLRAAFGRVDQSNLAIRGLANLMRIAAATDAMTPPERSNLELDYIDGLKADVIPNLDSTAYPSLAVFTDAVVEVSPTTKPVTRREVLDAIRGAVAEGPDPWGLLPRIDAAIRAGDE